MDTQTNSSSETQTTPEPVTGPFANYVQPDGTFRENWADSLPDNLRDIASTVGKYQTLPEVFSDLHRLRQTDGVNLPKDIAQATPAQLDALRTMLGAPDKAGDYNLDKAPEGYQGEWDAAHGQKVAEVFAKHHVPATVAKELAQLEASREIARSQAIEAETVKYVEQEVGKLKQMWGEKFTENAEKAKVAATKLGVNLEAIQDAKLAEVFFQLHTWMSEDTRIRTGMGLPDTALSLMTENPRAMAQDIIRNPSNPKHRLYHSGDSATIKLVEDMYIRSQQM